MGGGPAAFRLLYRWGRGGGPRIIVGAGRGVNEQLRIGARSAVTRGSRITRGWTGPGAGAGSGRLPRAAHDWDAQWELFHDHPRGAPCSCYARLGLASRGHA